MQKVKDISVQAHPPLMTTLSVPPILQVAQTAGEMGFVTSRSSRSGFLLRFLLWLSIPFLLMSPGFSIIMDHHLRSWKTLVLRTL